MFGLLRVVRLCLVAGLIYTTTATAAGGSFSPDTRVVLKADAAQKLIRACGALGPDSRLWDPEPKDLALADAALQPALATALKSVNDDSNTGDYYRQYAGGFYEGDHVIYVLGFHRSYIEALPENLRGYWRSSPVRGGPGHTRFWCAHWVKETKHLIPALQDGRVQDVAFRGSRSTISFDPHGVATIGAVTLRIPDGYSFQGSWYEGDAVVGRWLDESDGRQTRLEMRLFDVRPVASRSTPAEIEQLAEKCLAGSMVGIASRRTDFHMSPVRHLSLAGDPAASTEWTGKMEGSPWVGAVYCGISARSDAVAFHVQSAGDAATPAMRSTVNAIEAAMRRHEGATSK